MRKTIFTEGNYYHILNRSIAKFQIFNNEKDYKRFLETLGYYIFQDRTIKFSRFLELPEILKQEIMIRRRNEGKLASIVCFCLMPTHFHLILKQLQFDDISKLMSDLENSYSRYFNLRHKRKGPLWESRFKSVPVSSNEQLLHLSRYIHLNPVSADIVKKPEDWKFSSYHEYLKRSSYEKGNCEFRDIVDLSPRVYRKFTEERISYQKELSKIKKQLLENYSG